MSQVVQLLQAFDDVWSHGCESLHSALKDVSSTEASWQDSSYAVEPLVQGLPEPGTICWHVAHLEHCARHYTAILRGRPLADEPVTLPPGMAELSELTERLERARRLFRTEIENLSDMDLQAFCARGMNVAEFLRMAIRHEAWHAGQIAVIRRLYRQRSRD
jgi:DinB superfamily